MSDLPDTDPGVPGIAEREDPPAAEPAVRQAEAEPGEPAAPQTPAGSAAPSDAGRTGSSGIADGVERSLDPRYIGLQRIIGGVVAAAILAGVPLQCLILILITDIPRWAIGLGGGAGMLFGTFLGWALQVWPALEHRHAAYTVSARGVRIRRGVWWRRVIDVPRSRVQHTDVSQGPFERRFGLATLRIHTAGTENAQVDLSGLAYETAVAIRDHLVEGGEDDAV